MYRIVAPSSLRNFHVHVSRVTCVKLTETPLPMYSHCDQCASAFADVDISERTITATIEIANFLNMTSSLGFGWLPKHDRRRRQPTCFRSSNALAPGQKRKEPRLAENKNYSFTPR